jgi:alkanesulfonate monooxygenase SsuD/methylene tetrahydromethanopterin reductase-like flavin-dependent oxidoreductase (luciferase family)
VLNRVAHLYDGWLPFLPDPDAYRSAWQTITERAIANGRDPTMITPALYATVNIDNDADRAQAELDSYVRAYYGRSLAAMSKIQAFFGGPPDDVTRWLTRYVDAGARHLVLRIGSLAPQCPATPNRRCSPARRPSRASR